LTSATAFSAQSIFSFNPIILISFKFNWESPATRREPGAWFSATACGKPSSPAAKNLALSNLPRFETLRFCQLRHGKAMAFFYIANRAASAAHGPNRRCGSSKCPVLNSPCGQDGSQLSFPFQGYSCAVPRSQTQGGVLLTGYFEAAPLWDWADFPFGVASEQVRTSKKKRNFAVSGIGCVVKIRFSSWRGNVTQRTGLKTRRRRVLRKTKAGRRRCRIFLIRATPQFVITEMN